jgi:hypothetical protein
MKTVRYGPIEINYTDDEYARLQEIKKNIEPGKRKYDSMTGGLKRFLKNAIDSGKIKKTGAVGYGDTVLQEEE